MWKGISPVDPSHRFKERRLGKEVRMSKKAGSTLGGCQ